MRYLWCGIKVRLRENQKENRPISTHTGSSQWSDRNFLSDEFPRISFYLTCTPLYEPFQRHGVIKEEGRKYTEKKSLLFLP